MLAKIVLTKYLCLELLSFKSIIKFEALVIEKFEFE